MTPDGGPLVSVEPPGLAQHRRVDGDLAEIVEARRPAQPVDIREGQVESACKLVDVARDPERVAIGGRIPLVDDVRERLECAQRLALESREAEIRVVNGEPERNEDDDVP